MFVDTGDCSYLYLIKVPSTTLDTFTTNLEPELLYHKKVFYLTFGVSSGLWFFLSKKIWQAEILIFLLSLFNL